MERKIDVELTRETILRVVEGYAKEALDSASLDNYHDLFCLFSQINKKIPQVQELLQKCPKDDTEFYPYLQSIGLVEKEDLEVFNLYCAESIIRMGLRLEALLPPTKIPLNGEACSLLADTLLPLWLSYWSTMKERCKKRGNWEEFKEYIIIEYPKKLKSLLQSF